jgi:Icc-related predicted phosphoesterase
VREFLDRVRPEFFFCGHIHEAEGTVLELGQTHAASVGKRGYLLDSARIKP